MNTYIFINILIGSYVCDILISYSFVENMKREFGGIVSIYDYDPVEEKFPLSY